MPIGVAKSGTRGRPGAGTDNSAERCVASTLGCPHDCNSSIVWLHCSMLRICVTTLRHSRRFRLLGSRERLTLLASCSKRSSLRLLSCKWRGRESSQSYSSTLYVYYYSRFQAACSTALLVHYRTLTCRGTSTITTTNGTDRSATYDLSWYLFYLRCLLLLRPLILLSITTCIPFLGLRNTSE